MCLRAAKRNQFQNKDLIIEMILSGADIKQQAILRTKVYLTPLAITYPSLNAN
jgi:hypothetical protein